MHTRRKFLVQGSVATTAMLALKPLKSVAGTVSRLTGFNGSSKLVFLHTATTAQYTSPALLEQVANIKRDDTIVLSTAVAENPAVEGQTFDLCIDQLNDQTSITSGYKIFSKGNIKTGVISALPNETGVVEKVNTLAAWLKKEKGCSMVVCLSKLGYKKSQGTDDIALAKHSAYLDLIIGGDTENFHQQPVVLLNNKNEEVIIHAADKEGAGFGKIAIDFNEWGRKNNISFNN